MVAIKPGADLLGLRPEILVALISAQAVYAEYETDLVITSASDGMHSVKSLHYAGQAIDLRTRTLPNPKRDGPRIADRLDEALGRDFDVLFEGDHIHIEYQPRRPT